MNSLEQEAQKRKDRLLKLRQKTKKTDEITEEKTSTVVDEENKENQNQLKFRNFQPTNPSLLEKGTIIESEVDVIRNKRSQPDSKTETILETVEDITKDITEKVIVEQKVKDKEDVDLSNLAPAKPNWDLRRDIQRKLARLEAQTQLKIHEIVRERIKLQANSKLENMDMLEALKVEEQLDETKIGDDE